MPWTNPAGGYLPSLPLPNDQNTDSVGAVTVKVTDGEVTAPKFALIKLEPICKPVASPWVLLALLIVATLVVAEAQVTVVVNT